MKANDTTQLGANASPAFTPAGALSHVERAHALSRESDVAARLLAAVRARNEGVNTASTSSARESGAAEKHDAPVGMRQLDQLEHRVVDALVKAALQAHNAASIAELALRDVDAADAIVAKAERVRALARHLRMQALEKATAKVSPAPAATSAARYGSFNASI